MDLSLWCIFDPVQVKIAEPNTAYCYKPITKNNVLHSTSEVQITITFIIYLSF